MREGEELKIGKKKDGGRRSWNGIERGRVPENAVWG
jgi:hypothetical protein